MSEVGEVFRQYVDAVETTVSHFDGKVLLVASDASFHASLDLTPDQAEALAHALLALAKRARGG